MITMLRLLVVGVVVTHDLLAQHFLLLHALMHHVVVKVIFWISAVFAMAPIHGHAAGISLVYLFEYPLVARNSRQLLLKVMPVKQLL